MPTDLDFNIMGLDVSSNHTGWCVMNTVGRTRTIAAMGGVKLQGQTGRRKPGPMGPESRGETWSDVPQVTRIHEMQRRVLDVVDTYAPELLVVEGYSYASPRRTHLPLLAECTGMVKKGLIDRDRSYIVVPPSTLKKFLTNSGKAGKGDMIEWVNSMTGEAVVDDNVADATALALFGLCLVGNRLVNKLGKVSPWKKWQRDSVAAYSFTKNGSTISCIDEVLVHVSENAG